MHLLRRLLQARTSSAPRRARLHLETLELRDLPSAVHTAAVHTALKTGTIQVYVAKDPNPNPGSTTPDVAQGHIPVYLLSHGHKVSQGYTGGNGIINFNRMPAGAYTVQVKLPAQITPLWEVPAGPSSNLSFKPGSRPTQVRFLYSVGLGLAGPAATPTIYTITNATNAVQQYTLDGKFQESLNPGASQTWHDFNDLPALQLSNGSTFPLGNDTYSITSTGTGGVTLTTGSVTQTITVTFTNLTQYNVAFFLNGGAGLNTRLNAGATQSYKMVVDPGVQPIVGIYQVNGPRLNFTVSDHGNYDFILRNGQILNAFAP